MNDTYAGLDGEGVQSIVMVGGDVHSCGLRGMGNAGIVMWGDFVVERFASLHYRSFCFQQELKDWRMNGSRIGLSSRSPSARQRSRI